MITLNVIIYARYSSHTQTEQSIEGQLQACYEFAKRNNHVVVGEYIDRAQSGTSDNRPEFLRMIEDSNKKFFSGVLVYQLDRFARNRYDSAVYKAKLKKNGVRVFSARENITDDASGILIEGLLESMAEYYSAELSQKVQRGMSINAEKCLSTGGNIALGYKVDENKKFQINEEEATVVKKIFELYSEGKTITEIAEKMNSQGIKTSRGNAFNKNSLTKMLNNKRYIGIYTYKDMEIPDGIPRIVSDELFAKVAEKLKQNKKAPARAKAKEEYILTTKLFCGKCHDMMVGVSGTSVTKRVYSYYYCSDNRKGECDKKPIRKTLIEKIVIEECRKLLTKDKIELLAKKIIEYLNKDKDTENLRRIQRALSQNEKQQQNVIEALSNCDNQILRENLFAKFREIDSAKQELTTELSEEMKKDVPLDYDDIVAFLNSLRKGNVQDLLYKKTLVNILVNKVFLYDDKLTIFLNVSNKEIEITKDLIEKAAEEVSTEDSSLNDSIAPPKKSAHQRGVLIFLVEGTRSQCLHWRSSDTW